MKFKKALKENTLILTIEGELDMYNTSEFRIQVESLIKQLSPQSILFSCQELTYVDSSGIGLFLSLLKKANQENCPICFCYMNPQVLDIIKLTRILPLFDIKTSEASALQYLKIKSKPSKVRVNAPIIVDESHDLFNITGMKHKTINIDFTRIRYISHIITQDAPSEIKEYNLLEQQVSEVIKNGIRHGNRNDINKSLKIWWNFNAHTARLIVEDEGKGIQNLEEWLNFYQKRMECFENSDFEKMSDYLSYRTKDSTIDDGGNALFAAVEYWNKGVVLNSKRNAIALARGFKK